jgi:hypothetical protein
MSMHGPVNLCSNLLKSLRSNIYTIPDYDLHIADCVLGLSLINSSSPKHSFTPTNLRSKLNVFF